MEKIENKIHMKKIPFNHPTVIGNELEYIQEVISSGKMSGNNKFSNLCETFLQESFDFGKCLLTTSCTDALEMCALLLDISPGDEIILPSYTFVSTANAFLLRGAKLVFVDSCIDNPNIDLTQLESMITSKTKAIVVVHYAGFCCDMEKLIEIVSRNNILLIEDAAQAIGSKYKNKYLGSFGTFATISFHETKNISCGEGGVLIINDPQYEQRAEILREKGTNRSNFFKGKIDKYGWVDIGSSFLPSDILAAYLYAQLEKHIEINTQRRNLWYRYYNGLKNQIDIELPIVDHNIVINGHIFYVLCKNENARKNLITFLDSKNVNAVFHYQSLHQSDYFLSINSDTSFLPNADKYTACLLRLPIYYSLDFSEVDYVIQCIKDFYHEYSCNN